jgi:hypothetical protein
MAKPKTDEETLTPQSQNRRAVAKVEFDFETVVASGIAEVILNSRKRPTRAKSSPKR